MTAEVLVDIGIDQTQRNAAKAVGVAYLLTSALAYFAEFLAARFCLPRGRVSLIRP